MRATTGNSPRRAPWVALLLLLAGALCGPGRVQAEIDRAGFMRLSSSVFKVEVQRSRGGYSLGSGVAVTADRVVTNCHVTAGAEQIHVLRGDQRWRVASQAVDAEHDLCLLRVPGLRASPVALGQARALQHGQAVTAIGYTGGLSIQAVDGRVVALHALDGGAVVQSTNWFTSGASGGGLFDAQWRLVGVLTFRMRGGQAHYFAGAAEWLQPLLADPARDLPLVADAPHAPAYWQHPAAAQPAFLQAMALERDRRWPELEALALAWRTRDAASAEPWRLYGLALARQGKPEQAREALEEALRLSPEAARTWLQLGLLLVSQRALDAAREVRLRLQGLDPDLASELDRALAAT